MDIFKPQAKKKTAAFHLSETNLKEIAKIARTLKQSKSAVADQLLAWGLEGAVNLTDRSADYRDEQLGAGI